MFIQKSQVEKILKEKKLCTADQFRNRCENKRWSEKCYVKLYKAVIDHFGIPDPHGTERRAIRRLLNSDIEKGKDPSIEIGPKRRHIDYSLAESSDEGDVHDISLSSAMSIDDPDASLDVKRENAQLKRDLKGNKSLMSQFIILFN